MAKVKPLRKKYKKGEYPDKEIIDIINRGFFKDIKGFGPGLFLGTGKYLQSILRQKDLTNEEITKICQKCYNPDVDLALELIQLRPDYSYFVKIVERNNSLTIENQHLDIVKKLEKKKKLSDLMVLNDD